jgi:hypothetical protein
MRTWKCKQCSRIAQVSYEDVLEIGTPICCDSDMELLPGKPVQIVVEIKGGVLQSVHSSDPTVKVDLLDWDNVKDGDASPTERRRATKLERKTSRMTEVF